jgi:hypothetical protein
MNELSKNLLCIQIRSGVEIWQEQDKIKKLQEALSVIKQSTFIHFGDMTINSADVVGIFDAKTMEDSTNRKNGMWKCVSGEWHGKYEKCECSSLEAYIKKQE